MSEFADVVKEISENHRKILDDWCKAYLAELYEEGLTNLKPGMFVLCERDHYEENGKFVKNYYARKKTEQEETVEQYSIWQPIETAPKDGTHVLLFIEYTTCTRQSEGWYNAVCWETEEIYLGGDEKVSHWMPLPEPPKLPVNHYCSDDPLHRDTSIHCTDDRNETGLIVSTQTGWFKVNYCPFCGEKA